MKTEKKCTGCLRMLPIESFSITNHGTTYRGKCKKCCVKATQEYKKNLSKEKLEEQKLTQKESRARKYKDNKEVIKQKCLEWRLKNREKARLTSAKWRKENPEKNKKMKNRYATENKERISVKNQIYRKDNCIKLNEYSRNHYRENTTKHLVHIATRRAKKLKCIPEWDVELTKFVYNEAASLVKKRKELTGIAWHIDHIIPLQGKNVTGLHVWNNLRVITATENLRKKNLFNGDYFGEQFVSAV